MCGFVTVVGADADVSVPVICAMRDLLAHRGPDGPGLWVGNTATRRIGLGHRRLSLIDLSAAANQPMVRSDVQIVIVDNGEMYKNIDLRADLEQIGHLFSTQSDTEVLLAAYEEWGT